ncbi:restriction endonuclease subunit S [Lactobacillus gallinarum]|uniref:restriction endonuclease subunit S n=1 Tax=Lactobacillus gallinarum TaxID=52242 RepID=UPI0024BB7B6D|nr:restriction endonuclease subunit S [Lactobacillus gallinarum]
MVTWEQRKLKDLFKEQITNGIINNPGKNELNVKDINVINLYNGDSINIKDLNYINVSESKLKKYQVRKGDIFLTRSSLKKEGIAKSNILMADSGNYVFDDHVMRLRFSNKVIPYFMNQLLFTSKVRAQFISKAKTGSMTTIGHNDINKTIVNLPTSTSEQKSVATILRNINHLIYLQQRKLDELIQIKEGIGQGLLNRHYRNLSIRFNQENSPWKQTKLGKIASFVNGRAFKQKELMNRGLYPVLRVGNFYTNNKWYYSNLNLSPDKYANKGDLLYTWSASFGPHVWKGPKVIYHYHIWKINFDPAVISKAYLYEFLKLDKKEILANSNGSTMIHITKKDMENKMITVPDMNEQIKIGKILEKLDLKIELNKNKLNNLKSVKQFLLQKMFM